MYLRVEIPPIGGRDQNDVRCLGQKLDDLPVHALRLLAVDAGASAFDLLPCVIGEELAEAVAPLDLASCVAVAPE